MMFNQIHFAALHNLWYLPLVFGILFCIGYGWYKRRQIINNLAAPNSRIRILKQYRPTMAIIKAVLYAIGFICLFIALLRPQWDEKERIVSQTGRDVLLCLDISRSMLAQDVTPDRLHFAKNKIKRLLTKLSCERVGLLLFASSTIVQCPLTSDYDAFLMFLNQIDADTISHGGTSLARALLKAIELFKSMPTKKTKLVVVCTDGEDFSSDLAAVKAQAQEEGVTIITLGIGSADGAPIPIIDVHGNQVGYQKDEHDAIVISKLDEAMLADLSNAVGGKYIKARDDDADLREIVSFVQQFEKEDFDDKKFKGYEEKYFYFVAVSFVCFLLQWLL